MTTHAISREEANEKIRKFLEIRDEANSNHVFDQLSTQAKTYFGSNALSFVFWKDQLDQLFQTVNANAYRIYFAAQENGAPTLVVFPCTMDQNEYTVANVMSSGRAPGEQYPTVKPSGFTKDNFDVEGDNV